MGVYGFKEAFEDRNNATWIEVRVTPNADETEFPSGFDEWRGVVLARVSEPAKNRRANKELVSYLSDLFDADTRIVSGEHSRSKTVEVNLDIDLVIDELRDEID